MSKLTTLKHYMDLMLTPNKLAYIGWVGHKNLGDEILFDAHKALFPQQNLKFYMRSRLLDRVFPFAQRFDGAFLGGGTLINQADIWLKQLDELERAGVPLLCFGTGVACREFWSSNPAWGWQDGLGKWGEVLKRFRYVGVRGPRSQAYLQQVGVTAEIVGDTALALAPDLVSYRPLPAKPLIGVNIGYAKGKMWGDEAAFVAEATRLVGLLLDSGYAVRLLPVWDKDLEVNRRVMALYQGREIDMVEAHEDYHRYAQELAACDLFVGEKLHATIIATMHRVPSVMLEYRPKCLEYMMSVGMEQYSVRTSQMVAEQVVALVAQLADNHQQVHQALGAAVMKYKALQQVRAKELY